MNASIRPGKLWLDTSGKPIQAHGFSVLYRDGVYYWYGENKEFTRSFGRVWTWGIRCYTSRDLYNWEDRGLIIPPEPDDIQSPMHPNHCIDRPHILYCEKTRKYVAWIKVMGSLTSQFMCVMQADAILGPYEYVHKYYHPLGMDSGDFTLCQDGERAYMLFDRPHFELICANTSFNSQIGCVLRVPGSELYIALADRWQPGPKFAWGQKLTAAYYARMFRSYVPDTSARETKSLPEKQVIHMENTRRWTYVWLPITWEDGVPRIRWRDEWRIEDFL